MGRLIENRGQGSQKEMTVREAFEKFELHMSNAGYAKKTISTYRCHVLPFIEFLENDKPIALVRLPDVEAYQGFCRQKGNRDTTIQTYVKSIRTFLYWCMGDEQGFIERRYKIKLPKASETMKQVYTAEELELILRKPQTLDLAEWRNWAVVNLCVRTGLRLSSLTELKWVDIDYQNRRLLMRHSKNGRQQFVPLCSDAIEVLAEWQSVSPVTKDGYVFFSMRDDGKMKPNNLYQAIRRYNLNRGVTKTSVHLLRHTFATVYLQKGGNSMKLQKILGHSTQEMVSRYVHFATSDLVDGIDDLTV